MADRRPKLKDVVADSLYDLVSNSRWARVNGIADVKEITFSRPTNLITLMRVVTEHSGVHYYEIRVKENI